MAFNSYQSGLKNDYLYNGKELQEDLDLNWYDYGARMYMADLGRWGVIDPMAGAAPALTPYRYGFNNPMMFTDPNGMFEYSDGYSTKDSKYETGSVSHSGSFAGNAGDIEKGSTAGTTVMVDLAETTNSSTTESNSGGSSSSSPGEPQKPVTVNDIVDYVELRLGKERSTIDAQINWKIDYGHKVVKYDQGERGATTRESGIITIYLAPEILGNAGVSYWVIGHELVHAYHYSSGMMDIWAKEYGQFRRNITEFYAYTWSVAAASRMEQGNDSWGQQAILKHHSTIVNTIPYKSHIDYKWSFNIDK